MSRIIKLISRGLILSGVGLIVFNQQPYERQQKIIGLYKAGVNSYRSVKYLYGVTREFKELLTMDRESEEYKRRVQEFKATSADKIEQLCEVNRGVYARMGQIVSGMSGVVPETVSSRLKKLQQLNPPQMPYEQIKTTLTQSLQKPMKQLFDGFQTKPFKVGLFYQSHKSILLQNYKQSVVKVMPSWVRYQSQYDLKFINKMVDWIGQNVKNKRVQLQPIFNEYKEVLRQAEQMTKSELDFNKQYENASKLQSLIYDPSSSFYIPYYYKKYATANTIIRQYIDGIKVSNVKGLKQIGLEWNVAYALIMAQLHKVMAKYGMINGKISQDNIVLRKYIKPAKRGQNIEEQIVNETVAKKGANMIAKGKQLLHPHYQVVFLSINNMQPISDKARETINSYWTNIKKKAKKMELPLKDDFYKQIPDLNNLKNNTLAMLQQKYYLYEPLLEMFDKFTAAEGLKGKEGKK